MKPFLRVLRTLPLLVLPFATPAIAMPTTIDLAAEASRPAANDLLRATVFAEATGRTPGELARQVNGLIAQALRTAKPYTTVSAQSGATSSYPNYTRDGKIESWRMRSQLVIESKDSEAVSDLLGKLQGSLGVAELRLQPSPETRKFAENAAMLDALKAFQERAKIVADALGKGYRIKQIVVNTSGGIVQPMMRSAAMSVVAEAMPMPVEAGESQISASDTGQIELVD